ncbi:hypothetical protein J6590_073833 [Homalodisca vitripennis]|nr:hypothetical protein J6590_073833 [Homalodisca vitripennis]
MLKTWGKTGYHPVLPHPSYPKHGEASSASPSTTDLSSGIRRYVAALARPNVRYPVWTLPPGFTPLSLGC